MIGEKVVNWYEENGRDLPWRKTKDAYKIWISEVILQQTRIAQGTSYYHRFIEHFPNIESLANSDIDTVLKYWEGLGYYSRARNLHAAAKQLMTEYQGQFPTHYEEIMKLKGIGPYSARAIGSFAFGNATGVIDGNVFRVMSRVLNDFSPIDEAKTRTKFQTIIDKWVEKIDAAPFNHGIMDIGSTICTPTNPACLLCPLEQDCVARKEATITLLPVKGKKLNRSTKYFHFYVIEKGEQIAIQQRPMKGLWGGLWEIPNEEVSLEIWQSKTSELYKNAIFIKQFKHIFTHFDMELQVFRLTELPQVFEKAIWVEKKELEKYAFSKAVLKIIHRPSKD
ncbi:MAG: A/G-specific adenine glycosylase [Bacteroidia bacterium]